MGDAAASLTGDMALTHDLSPQCLLSDATCNLGYVKNVSSSAGDNHVIDGIAAKGFTGNGLGPDAIKKSFKKGLEQALTKGLKLTD